MTNQQIQAIGNFLQYYHSDLLYITKFQEYKEKKISFEDYVMKDDGTFYSFLIEYRVTRNYMQGTTGKLLFETLKWVNTCNADDVDLFTGILLKSGLTRGNTTTSLASKILFLNNPWEILPMDTLTRKAFQQAENKYSVYRTNLDKYRITNKMIIDECLSHTTGLTSCVEQDYYGKLKDLHVIRENRMIDKLLWSTRVN
jgi:hypothetical protein